MGFPQKLKEELEAVAVATTYFAAWLGFVVALKALVLAEYQIAFHQWSLALVGALVLAKVVLILEHVSLGGWTRNRPPALEVLVRTGLYALGVVVVLLLEKAFEGRHEHGGFGSSLRAVLDGAEIHHVGASALCLTGALLVYNALSVVRRHLGAGGLRQLFLSTVPPGPRPMASTHPPPVAKGQSPGHDPDSRAS
jgi:hypothetical protein